MRLNSLPYSAISLSPSCPSPSHYHPYTTSSDNVTYFLIHVSFPPSSSSWEKWSLVKHPFPMHPSPLFIYFTSTSSSSVPLPQLLNQSPTSLVYLPLNPAVLLCQFLMNALLDLKSQWGKEKGVPRSTLGERRERKRSRKKKKNCLHIYTHTFLCVCVCVL